MKLIQTVLVFALAFVSLNVNSQDVRFSNKTDSLEREIVKILNETKWDYWYSYPNYSGTGPLGEILDIYGKIEIENGYLTFQTKNLGVVKVNLLEDYNNKIIYYSKYNMPAYIQLGGNTKMYIQVPKLRFIKQNSKEEILYKEKAPYLLNLFNTYPIIKYAEELAKELEEFKILYKKHIELQNKPTVTEEQRKYIVQANAQNEAKNYFAALKLYENAIGINAFTYPSAYYNMALIAAQIKNYHYANFNMKKYLILSPDASDTRAAQDKIYEWEYLIKK